MSDITRQKTIDYLYYLKIHYPKNLIIPEYIDFAISSLETDEAYQLEYESTTKNDIDFKLKDYVSREAVRRIIKSPRTQKQMLNALNSLRNATECKAEDCINRDYTAKYVEEFANNEYVSQDEAETIYLIADGIRHIPSALPKVTKKDLGVDTISRSDVLKLMQDNWHTHNGDWAMQESMDDIRALPSVTPIRPNGHWTEEFNDLEGEVRFTCSSCGKYQLFETDFCYHCGSDNREVVEDGNNNQHN